MGVISKVKGLILGRSSALKTPPAKKIKFLCFHCGQKVETEEGKSLCSNCLKTQPEPYLALTKTHPPLFCPVMGLRGSGKTVYLHALAQRLLNFPHIYADFSFEHVDVNTKKWMRETTRILKGVEKPGGGKVIRLPETTPSETDSWGMILGNMPKWGNRQVIFRDFQGEMFGRDDLEKADKGTLAAFSFIRSAPVCWMFIDLSRDYHAEKSEEFTPDGLLTLYRDHVARKSELKKKPTIIVILTKADVLKDNAFNHGHQLSRNFYDEYVVNDELSPHLSAFKNPSLPSFHFDTVKVAEYLERMDNVSRSLKTYFRQSNFGQNFVTLAKDVVDLRFTMITSALSGLTNETVEGRPVNEVVIRDEFDPLGSRRVLDPLFWTLDLSPKEAEQTG